MIKSKVFWCAMFMSGIFVTDGITAQRKKYNFNSDWLLSIGDNADAKNSSFNDKRWKNVTLPAAFNEDEAFKVAINQLTATVVWYRKHFKLDNINAKQVFVVLEGVRQ